jgi:predicted N-acetyltransferase YhbS
MLELGHLFVEPQWFGRGIGRALVRDASDRATAAGYRSIVIQGDPNAARFYERLGAVQVGVRASSSIAGRSLPVFELRIAAAR